MQLIFVTGKGGVGKSAVTAALGEALASLNNKVAIVELGQSRMAEFFPAGCRQTLFCLTAAECFEEYAARHLPKTLLLFLKNRWVHHFVDAAPGLNELLLLGKIYGLVQENQFDYLLLDAPATGHALSLLEAPQMVLKIIRGGPLQKIIADIVELLHTETTQFWLVTQLEEAIVQETIQLHRQLSQQIKTPKRLLINAQKNFAAWTQALPTTRQTPAPLCRLAAFVKAQQTRQTKLHQKIEKEIASEKIILPWVEGEPNETALKTKLAQHLTPCLSKNY